MKLYRLVTVPGGEGECHRIDLTAHNEDDEAIESTSFEQALKDLGYSDKYVLKNDADEHADSDWSDVTYVLIEYENKDAWKSGRGTKKFVLESYYGTDIGTVFPTKDCGVFYSKTTRSFLGCVRAVHTLKTGSRVQMELLNSRCSVIGEDIYSVEEAKSELANYLSHVGTGEEG